MIPKQCKRLAEVDFPIAAVSKHSAREKSIRHGHPSTLHLWWARRPLAACRAMLMALLLPDPCDPHCPAEFKRDAKRALMPFSGRPTRWDEQMQTDDGLRHIFLEFIADFANWDNAAKPAYLTTARALVKAAHPDGTPLVVDPFAGGGSIPLEALRLGCDAFASDLNPVACLILKVLLEDIPRHGPGLAEEFRRVGAAVRVGADKELADFYPADRDGARPIAYLWARTIQCETPNCGAELPLISSFWLCKKVNRKWALRYEVVRPKAGKPRLEFEVFNPRRESEVSTGTVSGAKATCLCCGVTLPPERVRAQLTEQHGGADAIFDDRGRRTGGARLLAVIMIRPDETGRFYRLPANRDYEAVWKAHQCLKQILDEWRREGGLGPCPIPDEPLNPIRPSPNARGLSAVTRYGMVTFADLFTSRQMVALFTLSRLTQRHGLDTPASVALALALTRSANAGCSLCRWDVTRENHQAVFARQALPMMWDYSEGIPLSESTGGYQVAIDWIASVVARQPELQRGQVQLADATRSPLPHETASAWFTDPPYYDAIPYADLSDFFFVWLKRILPGHPMLCDPIDSSNALTPKALECVWNKGHECDGRPKDGAFFEHTIGRAFMEGRRILQEDGIGSVVFAHQSTEGWEALLRGLVEAGWTVTGSWPIATEMTSRVRAYETASLATSVHLVCRPRPTNAPIGDWSVVLRELSPRVEAWMDRLQEEGVRGADLVFACIGPALEIFSRYRKVETAEGREVPLAEFLQRVWEEIGHAALKQILGTSAHADFGEDARLAALFLWTLRQTIQDSNGRNGNGGGTAEDQSGVDDVEDDGRGSCPAASHVVPASAQQQVPRRRAWKQGSCLALKSKSVPALWRGRTDAREIGAVQPLCQSKSWKRTTTPAERNRSPSVSATEMLAAAMRIGDDVGMPDADVTRILEDLAAGRRESAEDLLPLVYEQLRAIAKQRMAGERDDHTLQATALVHEAYVKLVGDGGQVNWSGRAAFFKCAAEAMRRILIDHARTRGRVKRGGDQAAKRVPLSVLNLAADSDSEEILALDEAICRLDGEDPEVASVVRLRFFAGLTVDDTAAALGISPRQADRHWAFARAWLFHRLSQEDRP